ncbi:unnamed protein product, partial [Mesorhabditis belari]|uniref:Uncharacterized protein n=1 Tax=Mesorhabditis belari TaxID=2138241 RepID=A0AAF3F622_9BILA
MIFDSTNEWYEALMAAKRGDTLAPSTEKTPKDGAGGSKPTPSSTPSKKFLRLSKRPIMIGAGIVSGVGMMTKLVTSNLTDDASKLPTRPTTSPLEAHHDVGSSVDTHEWTNTNLNQQSTNNTHATNIYPVLCGENDSEFTDVVELFAPPTTEFSAFGISELSDNTMNFYPILPGENVEYGGFQECSSSAGDVEFFSFTECSDVSDFSLDF